MDQSLLNGQDCIICIEPNKCILVQKNSHCDCEYTVHKQCLDHWIREQNKCVICRKAYDSDADDMEMSYHRFCLAVTANTIAHMCLCLCVFSFVSGIVYVLLYICAGLL